MKQKFFWDSWDAEYRLYYKVLLATSLVLMLAYCYLLFLGGQNSIAWNVNSSFHSLDIPLFGIDTPSGLLDLSTQFYLVDQKFVGGEIDLNPWSSYIYLILISIGILICLTMATYLSKFLYTISIGLLMVFIIALRIDQLGLFGFYDQTIMIGIFLLYAALSYYYNAVKTEIELKRRFLSFVGLTSIVALLVSFSAEVSQPFLYMASYSFIPLVVVSIIFIFLVSHEIVYGILRITTDSSTGLTSSNTKHFVILSLIYLLNVGMVQMKNSGFIDWDIFYINAFFLLIISSIIGFWGVRSREVLYGNILPFYPYTAYMYCGMLLLCFSFIGYHSFQQNDVTLEVIEDTIVFGHLGFGSMFFIYIIANFINYLLKNLPVYKIAYKEDNFPYFTSRLAGLIIVAALYFSSNQVAKDQGISAFYNCLGDLYIQTDRPDAAEKVYHESFRYVKWNHKANYNLGFLRNEVAGRIQAFTQATLKNPSEQAFVNLGLEYERNNQFFDAMFAYQDGLLKYPGSVSLKNNLAMLYSKTDVIDSTLYYLNSLDVSDFRRDVVTANLLGICADRNLKISDHLNEQEVIENYRYDVQANILASLPAKNTSTLNVPSRLNLITYAYVNNLAISTYNDPKQEILDILTSLANNEANADYSERLTFLKAITMYSIGQVGGAFELLGNLSHHSNEPEFYSTLLSIWSLEQGSPKLSLDFLDLPNVQKHQLGEYYRAISHSLLEEEDEVDKLIAERLANGDTLISSEMVSHLKNYPLKNKGLLNRQEAISNQKLNKAKELLSQSDTLTASLLYSSLGLDNPFLEESVAASVEFFNLPGNDDSKAYDILLKAINANRYSERLIKLYIDQCFRMNLMSYAENALLRLLDVLSQEEYKAYEREYDNRRYSAGPGLWE
ncbi:MAG: hypothetical protein JXQ96_03540 [Cyclobacteriaceae bacterium]